MFMSLTRSYFRQQCSANLFCIRGTSTTHNSVFPLVSRYAIDDARALAKVMPGWNDSVRLLRSKALFWNCLWSDNGCPLVVFYRKSGKKAKSRYKYAVRSPKRRKDHIVSKKISSALTGRRNRDFWQ